MDANLRSKLKSYAFLSYLFCRNARLPTVLFASCGVKVLERNYVKKAKQHGINQVHGKRKLCRGELCPCQFLVHEYTKTNKLSYILLEMSVFRNVRQFIISHRRFLISRRRYFLLESLICHPYWLFCFLFLHEMPDHLQRYMTGVFSSSDNRCFDLVYIKKVESVKGAL